jgi:ABC-type bacteriocin/lantibiotic exporter with double-glycine peptidase domain
LSGAIAGWKTQRAQIAKLYDVIEVSDKWRMDSGPQRPEGLRGEITLEGVSLYRGENPVLLDVSYTIPAGKKIAIIGPSGTGKSTLFNILLRFLTPSAGQVKVDGVELHQFDLGFLRRKIALVDQMPQLISATVAENIAFSALDEEPINAQAAAEAAEKAGAIEFIQQLEQQFSEELAIGSDHDLSGGQKQRLAIARAFYKDAPIMLFDEPTSALDEASRNKVIEAIKNVHGKTILLVTHDMNVLAAVDQVVVLKDHKLVPVEEVGGLEAYMQHLESEEGGSSIGPDESVSTPVVPEVADTEAVPAPDMTLPQLPAVPAQAEPASPEPVVEKHDDGIEISLH